MKSSLAIIIGALCAVPAHAAVYAHYPFDSNYTDSSGNGRDGTLTDVGTTGNSGIITSTGNHVFGGGAMDFADEADYVALDSTTFSSGVPYTIAFWAQRDSTSNQWNMVVGDQSNNFFIALNNNNTVRWRSSNSTSARQQDFAAPADTDWHHYAFVASGTTITMYLDGDFVSTGTGKSTGFIVNGIGSAYGGGSYSFRGRIDEMWILDEAADASTVSNLKTYNSLVPEPSGLVLFASAGLLLLARRTRD